MPGQYQDDRSATTRRCACRSRYDRTKPRPAPPPPSSSAPRTRPAHGSPAHGSGVSVFCSVADAGVAAGSVGFAVFVGVVCGCFLLHAGAPSIAPANTTVRQITLVASRFMVLILSPSGFHDGQRAADRPRVEDVLAIRGHPRIRLVARCVE